MNASEDGVHATWGYSDRVNAQSAQAGRWLPEHAAREVRGLVSRGSRSLGSGARPRGRRQVGAGGGRRAGGDRGCRVDRDDIALATGACGPWRAGWQRWPTEDGTPPTRPTRHRHVCSGSRRHRPRRRVSRRYLPIEWIGTRKCACRKHRARRSIPRRLRKLWGRTSFFRTQR